MELIDVASEDEENVLLLDDQSFWSCNDGCEVVDDMPSNEVAPSSV